MKGKSVTQVVVTKTYLGSLKPATTFSVSGIDRYSKEDIGKKRPNPNLDAGDEVIVFLKHRDQKQDDLPALSAFDLVPSGLRLIVDDHVCPFLQIVNPGPYTLMRPGNGYGQECPMLDDFARQYAKSIAELKPIAERLSRPATKDSIPWLLQTLSSCNKQNQYRGERIGGDICRRLVELKDLPTLDQAMQIDRLWVSQLRRGFASSEGRAYLLQKLSDPALFRDRDRRQNYAQAISAVVNQYTGNARENDTLLKQVTQLALVAVAHNDEQTAVALLWSVQSTVEQHKQVRGQPAAAVIEPDVVGGHSRCCRLRIRALSLLHCDIRSTPS